MPPSLRVSRSAGPEARFRDTEPVLSSPGLRSIRTTTSCARANRAGSPLQKIACLDVLPIVERNHPGPADALRVRDNEVVGG